MAHFDISGAFHGYESLLKLVAVSILLAYQNSWDVLAGHG